MEAGLTSRDVRMLQVPFDRRRETAYPHNIELLRKLKEEAGRAAQAVPPMPERPVAREEEKTKPTPKKREEKPVRKKPEEEKPKAKKVTKPEGKPPEKKSRGISLTELKGVGEKKAEELAAAGIKDVGDLLKCDPEKIAGKTSFSEDYIAKLKKEAGKLKAKKS